jgi:cytochrome c-type biogenesis protein CcsB
MTTEYFSNLAMVTSVVIYLLAVVMFAVEWALSRQVVPTSEEVRERELVGAGAGAPVDPELREAVAEAERQSAPLTRAQRAEMFGRLGLVFTVFGLACSVAGVVARGIAAGRWPLANMYEFTSMAMVLVVAAYLVLAKLGMRWLGLPVALLATIGNGLAVTVFYVAVAPLVPSLHSVWFVIHITAAAVAGAAFNVGGLLSILYLIKHRAETRGRTGGFLDRLPSTRKLDVVAYRLLAFAFPLWTFAVAAGAIWAQYAWGRYWGWDPKETFALVTWVIYACYLHARATAGWRGTRAAVIAVIGLVSFWFNFIGVNLLFSGLHSYAGI